MKPIETEAHKENRKPAQVPCPSALHGLFACFAPLHSRDVANYLLSGPGASCVAGGAHLIGWSQVETERGVYDWTIPDGHVADWSNAGKVSVLLFAPVSYSVPDSYLPAWYAGPVIDNDVGSTCGSGRIPVYWNSYFLTAWQAFLTTAVDRYSSNASVVGIRAGCGVGFENYACRSAGPNMKSPCGSLLAGSGYSTATWVSYLEHMISWMAGLAPDLFQWSLNFTSYGTTDPDNVTALAQYAVSAGLKVLVSAGLQQNDKTNWPGSNAWLQVAAAQVGHAAIGQQTVGLSDPSASAPAGSNSALTGSLATLLPWSVKQTAQYLEIYTNDLLAAWCPTNTNPGYAAAQEQNYPAMLTQLAGQIN